ncbi:aminotransferase class V-fold PLP-dependent enzyme [Bacteroidota bacterium]
MGISNGEFENGEHELLKQREGNETPSGNKNITGAFAELESGVHAALETYSNVHRGSGHNSIVSTHLFEQARDIVLEYMGLSKRRYVVIFCTALRAEALVKQLKQGTYQIVSSHEIGLSIGVRALAVKRKALPGGTPFQSGGGTTKLISQNWVIWADAPDKFEAGTPPIVNVIAFAQALRLIRKSGIDLFQDSITDQLTASEILLQDKLERYSGRELLDELRQTLIGRSFSVPTMEGDKPYINLDNSASTPTFRPIWEAFCQTWRQPAQIQQEIIEEVRSISAGFLGAPLADYEIIFTSNTTEAINLAADSLSLESEKEPEPVVLNTFLEHSSNDLPWRMVPNCSLIRLSIDPEGFVDFNELDTVLCAYNKECNHGKKRIKLVALSGASNVLGICNNIAEISRIVHSYGAHLLVDAAQLVAHRKVDMEADGIDYLAFSAHKVYAPFGCGALVARKGLLNFSPPQLKHIQSSGEENAGGIAALGKAFVLLQRVGMDLIQEEEQALTRRALGGLSKIAGLTMYGLMDPDSPRFTQKLGVIVFTFKDMMSDRVAKKLSQQRGIGVRYGCQCAHILVKHILNVGPMLEGFQRIIQTLFPRIRLPGVTRVSLGIENSEEDVDTLIQVLDKIAGQNQAKGNRHSSTKQNGTTKLQKAHIEQQIKDFTRASALRVYSGV